MIKKISKISNEMKIVTVVPLQKGAFKTDLTYFTSKNIENGSIVNIPIRNKKILGLITSSEDATTLKSGIKDMPFKLKRIIEVKKHSIFKNEFLESAFLLSSYFLSKKNDGIIALVPSIFKEKYDEIEKFSVGNNQLTERNNQEPSENMKTEKLIFQASLEDRISFYKTLIRGNFALKKSVFIVLPTEYDIEIFYQALSKGIENFTFFMYGGLKPKSIIEKYKGIMNSNPNHGVLIIGTAQFLSIPRDDISTIIVEHESSNIYKIIPRPHFDLRIFAELYASKIGAKFILSDTLLRFETIARKDIDNLSEVYPITFRTNFNKTDIVILNPNPNKEYETINQNKKNNFKKPFQILSERSTEEIEDALKNKKNIFIFSLRKGLATFTICKDCNEIVSCEKCLAPVVLYLSRDNKKRMFMCNKCNTEKNPETVCANCGSWNLMPLGIGTDTIFEEVKNKFKRIKIFKLDKESVKTASIAKKLIKEFSTQSGPSSSGGSFGKILIGTEMTFFYLKEKVNLSVIASFDSLWSIPNYKMSEKIIQILLSMLSRTKEKLIIQTKNKQDPALISFKSENLLPFIREELKDRENLNYPPFKRLIKITYRGDKVDAMKAKEFLNEILKGYNLEIFNGFWARNKNKYLTNALIRINPLKWSLPELSIGATIDQNLKNLLSSLPPSYEITIDPEDLL